MSVVSRKVATRSASKPSPKPHAKDAEVGRRLLTVSRLNAWGAFLTAHEEEAGLVKRLARPGDRRSLHIALADAGEKKYRQALPIHLDHVKRHFAAYIEDGEAAAVESALMRMANAVRRESGL